MRLSLIHTTDTIAIAKISLGLIGTPYTTQRAALSAFFLEDLLAPIDGTK
jgi:hypothetical protein